VADTRNIFTVDLEEWFHICASGNESLRPENWDRLPTRVELTTRLLLDLLERRGIRATFFIVGWVAERHPELIETVRALGHEIGSHGYIHQKVYELGPDAFRADLRESLRVLSALGAGPVTRFRAPEWSINDRSLWALDTLAEEGVKIDASMAPLRIVGAVTYPRYPHIRQTPAGPITEVPPLVADRFWQVMPMGWGWGLRMSSSRRVLRTIEAVNRAGLPAVLTVHPWELDPDPPRVRLPARLHFAHYFRLSGFRARLNEVLEGAAFGRIGDSV
jgi:polysaccharide deacetylase family protein (PEP-CTERM system associated)